MIKSFIFWSFLTFWMFLHPTLSQLAEKPKPSLKPHGAILIYTDEGFTPPGAKRGCQCVTSGSGTPNAPYIIENWDIESSSFYGINIRETKVHFIIRNVKVAYKGSGLFGGILLQGVENGVIEKVDITGATAYGISLKGSKKNKLTGNSIVNNKGSGIYLSKSEGNTLENNTVKGSGIFGIHLEVSNENALSGNTVVENQKGGVFLRGFKNDLVRNTIKNNLDDGISADMVRGSRLISNTICGNKKWGIRLRDASDVTVDGNTICENGYGMYLEQSENNSIMNNTFTKNGGKEMIVEIRARKNRFINNKVDGKVKDQASSEKKKESPGSSSSGKDN